MPPLLILLFLFTAIPLLELWLLFQLSGYFGFWTTITVVLMTGIAGASLARWQGWRVMARVQTEIGKGIMPADVIGDGLLILGAGLFLITPGVLTDLVGLLLLVPPFRLLVKTGIRRWLTKHAQVKTNQGHTAYGWSASMDTEMGEESEHAGHDRVIDARVIRSESVDDPG